MGFPSPVQIPLTPNSSGPVWQANSNVPTVTLINQDQTNSVYIGNISSIAPGGPNTAPIGPNASITWPGNQPIYAVASVNTQPLLIIPGSVSYSPGGLAIVGNVNATVSGNVNITAGTVDVIGLGSPNQLNTVSLALIAASGTKVEPVTAVTQIGYHGEIGITFPVGTANPFIQVELTWIDQATGLNVATDTYELPGATAPGTFNIFMSGRAKANQVQLSITNLDTVNTTTVTFVLNQDSITRTTDNWYWENAVARVSTVPGFTLPPMLPNDETVLGILTAAAIPASTTDSWLFGMAPGYPVQLSGNSVGAGAVGATITAFAVPNSVYGGGGIILREVLSGAGPLDFTFIAPRAPIMLSIGNITAGGALTVSAMMVAQKTT